MSNFGGPCLLALLGLLVSTNSSAQLLSLVNGDFEFDAAVTSPPTGWTASQGTMYVTSGAGISPVDPSSAYSGTNFVTANRLAPNPDASFPTSQTMSIFQNVDVSPFSTAIDTGDRYVDLAFAYNSADPADLGIVTLNFFDSFDSSLGNEVSFQTSSAPTSSGAWATTSLLGAVPVGTRSIGVSLAGVSVGSGSARNVSFDAISAQLVSTPVVPPRDVVHANLIQFVDNGAWSWFQDERAIVDGQKGKIIVGSMANRDGVGGEARDGHVQTTHFDLATGSRTLHVHNDLESYGAGDDHNVPGLIKKSDGNILAFYAAHNRLVTTEDDRSYYRTFDVETETWSAESEYHWWDVIPDNAPGSGGTTYSNVFQLSAEDPDGDGHGRLYNIARTQQSPHIMYSDDNGVTWQYGGQLTKQNSTPPSGNNYVNGYYKYVSNGVDRIDMIATEYHPADYNNSIYHAYIQNGKLFDSAGAEIDNDIFDAAVSFDPAKVTSTDDFTKIFQSGTTENSRGWTTDIQSYDDGTIIALFKARAGAYGSNSANSTDHRVWYARFDPGTGQWTSREIAKAGARLFAGEYDYTGLGAIHPHDPNTLYISTEVDPVTDAALSHHEIYKGVTADNGATWTWTAITENSSFDNLRPIIPAWNGNDTAVLWWRGSMDTSHDFDTAVVGILDRKNEDLGLVHYVDASAANTTLADGSALSFTGPSPNAGAIDGSWHLRSGAGNDGTVFTADESGAENVPTLKTTLSEIDPGTYDVFAFFWSDVNQDWQIEAGLSPDDLMLFRMRGSQQAAAEQFDVVPTLDEGSRSLYRAYLGRVALTEGELLEAYVHDSFGSGNQSVWYDGIGYATVTAAAILGDFDGDGDVDGRDFLVWQRGYGHGFGDKDLVDWHINYGRGVGLAGQIGQAALAVPEPSGGLLYCLLTLLLHRMPLRV